MAIPPRCDICGREWNKRATAAMRRYYPDAVVCEHRGKCDHPTGERCQYYYSNGSAALR